MLLSDILGYPHPTLRTPPPLLRLLRSFVPVLLVLGGFTRGSAQIDSATRLTAQPAQFARLDFVVILRAEWQDPYASAEVRLDLELTEPSGRTVLVPCYYESGASGAPSVWRARCAPAFAGAGQGRFVLTTPRGRETSPPLAFTVAAPASRGFLRPWTPWCLRFDDGTPFRGLGENLGWESRSPDDSRHFKALHEHPRFNYEYLLGRLSAGGGNFFRTWMCAWNLPLEWSQVIDTKRYSDHPGRFNPGAIARLDQLVELAEATDTYLMLTLDPHVSFMGGQWERNAYNRRNGGPAATPAEFFTSEAAKARYRDRLRYLVARWGYSPHLAVWEFFNEIDHVIHDGKPDPIPDAVITAWHAEMSEYLRAVDPHRRPITTSISHREVVGLNAVPGLDLNQRHIYRDTAAIPATIRRQLAADGKPYVIGEYGYEWDWTKDFNAFAGEMDNDFKQGLWLGLFSPTPILPLSWWWEFFDQRNVTAYFGGVRLIQDRMLAAGRGEFSEVPAEAGQLRTLAVRCGTTLFAYLHNPGKEEARTTLRLTDPAIAGGPVTLLDPETLTWSSGTAATRQAEALTLAGLVLPPGATRIVILSGPAVTLPQPAR